MKAQSRCSEVKPPTAGEDWLEDWPSAGPCTDPAKCTYMRFGSIEPSRRHLRAGLGVARGGARAQYQTRRVTSLHEPDAHEPGEPCEPNGSDEPDDPDKPSYLVSAKPGE
jgi:hypothetical protein